ncbi:hypothetical protein BJV78DRAFT_1350685 [Lactifluus subvellereus]|nr:hypothetical protein BJV78DRAFT_1350685 [Lactifluus subvellereus]
MSPSGIAQGLESTTRPRSDTANPTHGEIFGLDTQSFAFLGKNSSTFVFNSLIATSNGDNSSEIVFAAPNKGKTGMRSSAMEARIATWRNEDISSPRPRCCDCSTYWNMGPVPLISECLQNHQDGGDDRVFNTNHCYRYRGVIKGLWRFIIHRCLKDLVGSGNGSRMSKEIGVYGHTRARNSGVLPWEDVKKCGGIAP